jgi:histone deacetylase 1/2
MSTAGKPQDDEDIASYVLAGLDDQYNGFVAAITASIKSQQSVSLGELYSQFLAYESRLDDQQPVSGDGGDLSANAASRGNYGGRNRGGRGAGRGNTGGRGQYSGSNQYGGGGNYGSGNYQGGGYQQRQCAGRNDRQGSSVVCQICDKEGHPAFRCWKRFNKNYQGPNSERSANAATGSYGAEGPWFIDSGATDHITGELDKLTTRERYNGQEQIHGPNGKGMDIHHIGQSLYHTPNRSFQLKNILHVPDATKNLLSTHKLASDNHAFIEHWPDFFSIKDQDTKKILLQGRSVGGLYPMPASSWSSNKQALGVQSSSHWHRRLGHPSSAVVQKILRENNIPFRESNKESVCDACQKAKSHQLPYPKSSSESSFPLELVFSDVWGPACPSVGRNKYYVSFIDDFSKFSWIYMLKNKYDVFQRFHDFQNHVERLFDRKILALQTDWGGG